MKIVQVDVWEHPINYSIIIFVSTVCALLLLWGFHKIFPHPFKSFMKLLKKL
jgi:hypothetical protein